MVSQYTVAIRVFDNSLDALYPELWAMESMAILEENIVAPNLVHRDFEPVVSKFGDTVNTRKPSSFIAKRKGVSDNVVLQDAVSTNIPVVLNQLPHVSFIIRDGEEAWSFKDLVVEYLQPAILAMAQMFDQMVLGQYSQFINNQVGAINSISSSNAKGRMLDLRNKLNVNKAYVDGRNLIWTPTSETAALNTDIFLQANTSGDGGEAMRNANLGHKLGFANYSCQNMASVGATTGVSGAINNASGYAKGTTSITVDGFVGAIAKANHFVVVDGQVHRIVSASETTGNTTGIVLKYGLTADVADNAVVTTITKGTVGADYAAGYSKELTVTGPAIALQAGQMVSFGDSATGPVYTIVRTDSSTSILLDRPLEAAVANGANMWPGPRGEYNFAFHRNAIALVVRPLSAPMPGTGARSAVVNNRGLSLRVTITYDGNKQGHLVTVDSLCGIKVLDNSLGAVLLG